MSLLLMTSSLVVLSYIEKIGKMHGAACTDRPERSVLDSQSEGYS